MSDVLSDKDAQKLFNQIGSALGKGDTDKLDELFTNDSTVEDVEDEEVEESPSDTPEEEESDDSSATPEKKEEEDTNKNPQEEEPADSTEEVEGTKEPDELVKLREQLAKLESDNHALRSQAGRVPHVQRRLQELDKRLEELSKKATSPSSQTLEKIQPKLQARLKALKETDPELADLLEGSIVDAVSGVAEDAHSRERETLTFLRETESAEHREQEATRLLDMYPNAIEVFRSDAWKSWKKEQTDAVKALAGSDNADDVDFAFQKYAKDMLAKHPELAAKTAVVETPAAKEVDPHAVAEAQKIEQDRQRKKSTNVVVGSPAAAAKTTVSDNPEELFKKYSESIRKEITG